MSKVKKDTVNIEYNLNTSKAITAANALTAALNKTSSAALELQKILSGLKIKA